MASFTKMSWGLRVTDVAAWRGQDMAFQAEWLHLHQEITLQGPWVSSELSMAPHGADSVTVTPLCRQGQ